jgi:putative flippase GtrA
MGKKKNFFFKIYSKKKKIFLITGTINTITGYLFSLIIYDLLNRDYNILEIGLLINFINISFSFATYKLFVFNDTNQFWLAQYVKSFVTYGLVSIINIIIMAFMVEILNINFFFVATFLTIGSPLLLYFMHRNFTYNKKKFFRKNLN